MARWLWVFRWSWYRQGPGFDKCQICEQGLREPWEIIIHVQAKRLVMVLEDLLNGRICVIDC
jgi:hypothetical protein